MKNLMRFSDSKLRNNYAITQKTKYINSTIWTRKTDDFCHLMSETEGALMQFRALCCFCNIWMWSELESVEILRKKSMMAEKFVKTGLCSQFSKI
jgi:hypothetical protein